MARSNEFFLISHWDFHEGSGTTLGDVEDSNTGTINGSVSWTTGIGTGGALEFSGDAGERVTFARAVNIGTNANSDPYEYSTLFWLIKIRFKTTSASGRCLWTHIYPARTDIPQPCIYIGTDGKVRCVFGSSLVQAQPEWYFDPHYVEADKDVTDGEWHEVAFFLCQRYEYEGPNNIIGYAWLDRAYTGSVSGAYSIFPGTDDRFFWLGAGLLDKTWPGVADDTKNINDPWTGTVANIKAYWWNGVVGTCTEAVAAVDDLLEYERAQPANALMFSCNT